MHTGTIVLPTFQGHVNQATALVRSIRMYSKADLQIVLIISYDDKKAFLDLASETRCELYYIEDLLEHYTGQKVLADNLLKTIGKFRYQALKKLLGVCVCQTELALVVDSETRIEADVQRMFGGGLTETTVLYSHRNWGTLPKGLTSDVREEVNYLLQDNSEYWFFESFNWIYSINLTKKMIADIEGLYGKKWVFRRKALFECQLYYQYAFKSKAPYRYVRAENIFIEYFGEPRAKKILKAFYASPYADCGLFEYAGHLLTEQDYKEFISDPTVFKHLRLARHEPAILHNVVKEIRDAVPKEYYFGEASMHRGDFVRGKTAILVSGLFSSQQDVFNLLNMVAGIECDLFIATAADSYLKALIEDVLKPIRIIEIDDEALLGDRSARLLNATNFEKGIKENRDIGTMSMLDKIHTSYLAMLEQEELQGFSYNVVVRLRPDIFSVQRIRDIFWNVAEHAGAFNNGIFFPNRFWSQGINDQFFFGQREGMARILESLSGNDYAACDYLNPEYYLAKKLIANNIKPVAFDYKYILTRNHYPDIQQITHRFDEQEHSFWSQTLNMPCWKDLSQYLVTHVSNIRVKNTLEPIISARTWRGRELEYFAARSKDKSLLIFTTEFKSPEIKVTSLSNWAKGLLPYLIAAGYPFFGVKASEANLLQYNKASEILAVKIDAEALDVHIVNVHKSWIVWLALKMLRAPRGLVRRGKAVIFSLARSGYYAIKVSYPRQSRGHERQ